MLRISIHRCFFLRDAWHSTTNGQNSTLILFQLIEFGQDLVEGAVSEGSELMSPNTITV